jgi:TolB protein
LSRDNDPELVLVRDDGIEMKRLTKKKGRDVYAAWSPDGTKIVFSTTDEDGRGLFVMDSTGGNVRRLTNGNDEGAAWSPDGKTIVYTHYLQRYVTQILAIRLDDSTASKPAADGKPAQKLTDGTVFEADAAWSPDGKTIAFASARSGNWRLCLMDPDGKNVRDISQTDNPFGNIYPAWSPDGKRIVYSEGAQDDTLQVFMIDADGKNKKQLTKDGVFNTYTAWSPDGKKLAYMSYSKAGAKGSLMLMNPDGSEQKAICRDQGAGHNGRPAWRPK